jgi:hypothetical protein
MLTHADAAAQAGEMGAGHMTCPYVSVALATPWSLPSPGSDFRLLGQALSSNMVWSPFLVLSALLYCIVFVYAKDLYKVLDGKLVLTIEEAC